MGKGGMPEGIKTSMFWVLGIGIIALILIIMLILFGNLQGNVGFGRTSAIFINETVTLQTAGDTPATAVGKINPVLSGLLVINATDGEIVASSNYTVTGVVFTNTTGDWGDGDVNVSGTVTYDSAGKVDTDNVIGNYSSSAINVAKQLPTTGTIIGVALLLVVLLGVLIFAIKKMMSVTNAAGSGTSNFG